MSTSGTNSGSPKKVNFPIQGLETEHVAQSADRHYFRFMDLPLEIRNLIYEHHLKYHRGFVRLFLEDEPLAGEIRPVNLGINLLLTSQQVHEEGVKVLYGKNTFCLLPRFSVPRRLRFACHPCCFAAGRWEDSKQNVAWKEKAIPTVSPGTRLLEQMGARNRANIQKVEIMLRAPELCCEAHLLPMSPLLPNLKTLILFFDRDVARYLGRNLEGMLDSEGFPDPTYCVEYYTAVARQTPRALKTGFDFHFNDHLEPTRADAGKSKVLETFGSVLGDISPMKSLFGQNE